MTEKKFWKNKRVLITGHTGFKGAWLSMWLYSLGANVRGYALSPPTTPSLFELCNIEDIVPSTIADVRDLPLLNKTVNEFKPEIIFHMAAQSLVRESYINPVDTYSTNVMGTVNLFEALRECDSARAIINVTTDKCYENKEWVWGYRESEPLGGYDPYSSSKACSELVTSAYIKSFFNPETYGDHGVALASARAGNVIGGGDWARDRLIPDCVRALLKCEKIFVRNPQAIRPWQHVLEPLSGYILLAQKLYKEGPKYTGAWNFGPDDSDAMPVQWIVENICGKWGKAASYEIDTGEHPHEAHYLKLDCSKAKTVLNWHPKWSLGKSLDKIIEWTSAHKERQDLRTVCLNQIDEYLKQDAEA